MKRIHVARHAPEAHLVKGFLESNGIAAVVRGEFLTSGWGELPVDLCAVWIENDEQYERADALIVSFLKGDMERQYQSDSWRCPQCGELLEGQFTQCWQCGQRRPA